MNFQLISRLIVEFIFVPLRKNLPLSNEWGALKSRIVCRVDHHGPDVDGWPAEQERVASKKNTSKKSPKINFKIVEWDLPKNRVKEAAADDFRGLSENSGGLLPLLAS